MVIPRRSAKEIRVLTDNVLGVMGFSYIKPDLRTKRGFEGNPSAPKNLEIRLFRTAARRRPSRIAKKGPEFSSDRCAREFVAINGCEWERPIPIPLCIVVKGEV